MSAHETARVDLEDGEWLTYDLTPAPDRLPREQITTMLLRVVKRAEADPLIRAVHVFGSYARGAMTCGDLDLLVETNKTLPRRPLSEWMRKRDPTEAAVRKLARGMPKVEISFISTPRNPVSLPEKWGVSPTLVWSRERPNATENLAQIYPDPSAGRYTRDHFISPKRTGNDIQAMETVMGELRNGTLRLTVRPFPERLWSPASDRPKDYQRVSKEVARLWPVAHAWFREQGVRPYIHPSTVFCAESCFAHLGKIDLYRMLEYLKRNPRGTACLIPHIEPGTRPEMYLFTRPG